MNQIVYAELADVTKGEITAPARSIILCMSPRDIVEFDNIVEQVSGMGDVLLGIRLNTRTMQDYIYLNEDTKDTLVKELHIINTIGENLGRPIYFVCPLVRQFPKWDVCKQHITSLFGQYNRLFPKLVFTCTNDSIKVNNSDFVDVTLNYMVEYFRDVKSVCYLPNTKFNGPDSAISIIYSVKGRCVAILDKPSMLVAKKIGLPFMIHNVGFSDMVRAEREKNIPKVDSNMVLNTGTDEFLNDLLKVVSLMSR